MAAKPPDKEKPSNSKRLLPVKSIMNWEPDEELKKHINDVLGLPEFKSELEAIDKADK